MSKGDDFQAIRDAVMAAYYEHRYPGRDMVMEYVKWWYRSIGLKQVCLWCGDPLPAPHRSFCSGGNCSYSFYLRYSWSWIRDNEVSWKDICPDCRGRKVEDLHHVVPFSNGGSFFKRENLVALCKQCHVKRHSMMSLERRHGGRFKDFFEHQVVLPGMEKPVLKEFAGVVL